VFIRYRTEVFCSDDVFSNTYDYSPDNREKIECEKIIMINKL